MKTRIILAIALAMLLAIPNAAFAQGNRVRTNTRIRYHNGPVLSGTTPVYLIFYGCWNCGFPGSSYDTQAVLADFTANLGLSPYFLINAGYPDSTGATYTAGNGGRANMRLGNRDFLIQQNWINSGRDTALYRICSKSAV